MRRVSKAGLAGVPGVLLSEQDRRVIASRLGVGGSGLGAAPGCISCGSVESGVAAEVFRQLGSPELAKAATDPRHASSLQRAAALASATFDATKFGKSRFAVLSGVGGPRFAQAVSKSATKLGNNDEAFRGALVLVFLTGALDDASGRQTDLSEAYKRALGQFKAAAPKSVLAGLGIPPTANTGLDTVEAGWTKVDAGLEPYKPTSVVAYTPFTQGTAVYASNDPKAYFPPARNKNLSDIGTALVSPNSLDVVPALDAVNVLWTWLVKPAQDAGGDTAKLRAAIASAKRFAASAESLSPDVSPQNAAKRVAAWIVRFHAESVTTWTESANNIPWGEFPGAPAGTFVFSTPGLANTGPGYFTPGLLPAGFAGWVVMHIRRFIATRAGTDALTSIAVGKATPFPMRVAALLRLASKQAIERTGQVGSYDSIGYWKPGPGFEQVPTGPGAVYASVSTMPPPVLGQPAFWAHVDVSADLYRATYRKEPTDHALLWFGAFGYGIGTPEYLARVRATEALRMAGSVPSPEDLVDTSNIFMKLFQSIGPALSVTLNWINQSIQVAIDALCTVFKVTMGPDIGGVVCKVFEALLKYIGGVVKGNIASAATLAKALLGFIGKLSNSDFMGAMFELFSGVNTSILFMVGGPFADFIGVPFMIVDEKPQSNPAYTPSMERMGAELTRENPFFLIGLVISVFALISSAGAPAQVGAVIIALAPMVSMLLATPIRQSLQAAREPEWIARFRNLTHDKIRRAVETMVRIVAGIIMGVMSAQDAARSMGRQLDQFAKKNALDVTTKGITVFIQGMTVKLVNLSVYCYTAVSSKKGFDFKELSLKILDVLAQFIILIPVFAAQLGFDAGGMATAEELATTGLMVVEDTKKGIKELFEELEPEQQMALVAELTTGARTEASAGRQLPAKTDTKWPLIAGLAAAAGLVIGFTVMSSRKA